ncbi:hypothetical protein E4T42_00657 [Aureobasidium subglaciale]|nr:hypothetical protein E4T42_00657 [Aureobasidium subglaciale]
MANFPPETALQISKPLSQQIQHLPTSQLKTKANTHEPWRRDPNGTSNLGADGVLRSLNANRTLVLDYRRLTPEEVKEYATPFGQEALDALVGVDGRDVVDEAVLWAVPEGQKRQTESRNETLVKVRQ